MRSVGLDIVRRRGVSIHGRMIEISKHPRGGERHIVVLEYVAAAAVICVIAVVLVMVFTYRPV